MATQRTELDKELSRLQKNARNKLYRLRKKGAINAQIGAAFNPVVPAAQLKGMSNVEKRQYAQRLRDFNSKETAFTFTKGVEHVIQAGGTPIKSVDLWERRIKEAELNVMRAENMQKLEQMREKVLSNIPANQVRNIDFMEVPFKYAVDDGRFTALRPVVRQTDYTEKTPDYYDVQKARIESALGDDRLKSYQRAIANKLRDNDMANVADAVSNLQPMQMAYLHFYTDFTMLAETWQYQESYDMGYHEPSEADSQAGEAALIELLRYIGAWKR